MIGKLFQTFIIGEFFSLTTWNFLDFEILPIKNNGQRLVDTCKINYVSSTLDILQFRTEISQIYFKKAIIVNITIVKQFHEYMEDNEASERPSYFLN